MRIPLSNKPVVNGLEPAVELCTPGTLKKRVARSFGTKVAQYHLHAPVQQRLIAKLIPRIIAATANQAQPDAVWVDIGCGDGYLEHQLSKNAFWGKIIGMDLAFDSVRFCSQQSATHQQWICGDIDELPLGESTCHGIIAASVLQWSTHHPTALKAISRVLQPGGRCFFSLFVNGSFEELAPIRATFSRSNPITLPTCTEIANDFAAAGLPIAESELSSETLYFTTAQELLKHLSAIGSTATADVPMSRKKLAAFCCQLEATCKTERGIPLTYTALLGTAHKRSAL